MEEACIDFHLCNTPEGKKKKEMSRKRKRGEEANGEHLRCFTFFQHF